MKQVDLPNRNKITLNVLNAEVPKILTIKPPKLNIIQNMTSVSNDMSDKNYQDNGLENMYDFITFSNTWKPSKIYPEYMISSNGSIKSFNLNKILKRCVRLYRHFYDYDDIVKNCHFGNHDWVDINIENKVDYEIHRKGSVRNKTTKSFITITTQIKRKNISIYLLYEEFHYNEYPNIKIYYDKYLELKNKYTHLSFDKIWEKCATERCGLLCIRFPDHIKDWNDHIEVGDVFGTSSNTKNWKCHLHDEEYVATPDAKIRSPLCSGCHKTTNERSNIGLECTKSGSDMEDYFVSLFVDHPLIKQVNRTVIGGGLDDVVITLKSDNKPRGIQIKTLVESFQGGMYPESYILNFNTDKPYPNNMLIVAINRRKTRFFVTFCENIQYGKQVNIRYTSRAKKYNENKFTDKNLFITEVIKLLPDCVEIKDIENRYNNLNSKEINMRNRLCKKLDELKIIYQDASNNNDAYDIFINGYMIQLKFTNNKHNNMFQVNMTRTGSKRPYSDTDNVDIFIYEIGGHEENFLIIPINELIEHGVVSSNNHEGKVFIYIPPPDYSKENWAMKYWNAFNILTQINNSIKN